MRLPTAKHAIKAAGLLSLTAMLFGLGGCVASEASRFEEQMSNTIPPGERANPDVAAAFGLEDSGRVSIASVNDHKSVESP